MADDLRREHLRGRLCAELRSGGVKLWLSPYVEDGNPNEKEVESLVEQYSTKLSVGLEECRDCVLSIQNDALLKLKENKEFSHNNLATVQIRCKGFSTSAGPSVSRDCNRNETHQIKIQIPLSAQGRDLESAVLRDLQLPAIQHVKLIFDGRVLQSDKSLQSQGVPKASRMMAIALHEPGSGENGSDAYWAICSKTHSAVTTLLNRNNFDMPGPELGMENQQGHSLSVDKNEEKTLILAMTLYERGRAAMKRGNLPLALVLFADADQHFKECNSEILKNADNVALLNLDIVWCYLCLRSVSHISDAERRLRECEAQFDRCYGKNLERVLAVKGCAGNEAALLARLHLLQGIVNFHQNKIDEARHLLEQTKTSIQSLKVSQEDLNKVVALGFSQSEALLGLRGSSGDVDAAVERIIQDRIDQKEVKKLNAKKRALDRERRKLGKTADGSQFIEPENVQRLVAMGYDRHLAVSALKHSNNVISQAVFLIQEQPHLLPIKKKCVRPSNEAIAQLAALGFDVDVALQALKKHNGDIERAVDDLMCNNGVVQFSSGPSVSGFQDENNTDEDHESSSNPPLTEEQLKTQEEEDLRVAEATEELEKDLPFENDNYLNITLEVEEQFLLEYLNVLNGSPHQ